MAQMFPPEISKNRSPAERDVFNRLKFDGPKSWHIFQSERVKPPGSIEREIDFLLLIPSQETPTRHWGAIICLEVKGGEITLDESRAWKTGSNTLNEPPLDQARAEMYALKDYLRSEAVEAHNLNLEKLPLAYAVVLPDSPSPIADESIFDRNVVASGQLIKRLEKFVLKIGRRSYKGGTRQFRKFDQAQLNSIIDLLPSQKQNQNRRISMNSANINQSDRELAMLTKEQMEALSLVEDDTGNIMNKRIVFEGGAGTGKTVLAAELAKRRSKAGDRVAFVCATRGEAAWAIDTLGDKGAKVATAGNAVDVIFQGTQEAIKLGNEFSRKLDIMEKAYGPDVTLAMVAFEEDAEKATKSLQAEGQLWDYLIVDELQYMDQPSYLEVLSDALKGGLRGGNWAMFGDFRTQNLSIARSLFFRQVPRLSAGYLEHVKDARATLHEICKTQEGDLNWTQGKELTINCRNTVPISSAAARVAGLTPPQVLSHHQVAGPEPVIKFWKDRNQASRLLIAELRKLSDDGVGPEQIAVLYNEFLDLPSKVRVKSSQGSGAHVWEFWKINEKGRLPPSDSRGKRVATCEVTDAAGMESDVVVLVVNSQPDGTIEHVKRATDYFTRIFYIGMTRAKSSLIILSHEDHQDLLAQIQQGSA